MQNLTKEQKEKADYAIYCIQSENVQYWGDYLSDMGYPGNMISSEELAYIKLKVIQRA